MTTLTEPPKQRRFNAKIGLSSQAPAEGRVDRTGGKYGAGLIRDVSVLTRGEALGHGFWCDAVMLGQCLQFMKAMATGLKCRFTHPGLCADGLAKKLGILLNPRQVGDQVIADLHFNTFAHTGPDGDLAGYVMDRADEEPEHFGTSIVFCSDWDAEDQFIDDNEQQITEDSQTRHKFISPDPDNKKNLPHARIAELCACDCVDDPAANPSGFFHRDLSTIQSAEGLLDYAMGLSTERPATVEFGVDPDRAKQFLAHWATSRGLTIDLPQKGTQMSKDKTGKLAAGDPANQPPADPNKKPDEAAAEPVVPENDMVTCPQCGATFPVAEDEPQPVSDAPVPAAEYAANHSKYVTAFGAENGTKWFLGKVKFSDAQKLHYEAQLAAKDAQIVSLTTELQAAKDRLASLGDTGAEPVEASPPPAGTEGGAKGAGGFASLFRVPTASSN